MFTALDRARPVQTVVALSVVNPGGEHIATGRKTIEVRSWRPDRWPLRDLLIVENARFLTEEGQSDPDGRAVALVDVAMVEDWSRSQVVAACSRGWQPGYFAWYLVNVRPLQGHSRVVARRGLYEVPFDVTPERGGPPCRGAL